MMKTPSKNPWGMARRVSLPCIALFLTALVPTSGHAETESLLPATGRENRPALPIETRVEIKTDAPAGTIARVTLVFPHSGFRITDWGAPVFQENSIRVEIVAELEAEGAVLPVLVEFSHLYQLGHLAPGDYGFEVHSGGHPLGGAKFTVPEEPVPPFPANVDLRVHVTEESVFADVLVVFTLPGYRMKDWGEPMRRGNSFSINTTAEKANDLPRPWTHVHESRRRYDLGNLSPGIYQIGFYINGNEMARRIFRVHEEGSGSVRLKVEPLTSPWQKAHPLTVIFRHPDGVDPASLGGHNLRILGPNGYGSEPRFTSWEWLRDPATETRRALAAHYEALPPNRYWTASENGTYDVLLTASVRTGAGDPFPPQRLGHFRVDVPKIPAPMPFFGGLEILARPGGVPIHYRAKLTLLLPSSNVDIESWGDLERVGNRFFVDVKLKTDGGIGLPVIREVSHVYDLGPLQSGHYGFTVTSFGRHVGTERFTIEGEILPKAHVRAENITEPSPHPHLFQVVFRSPHGMDLESIRNAPVGVLGPHGYRRLAKLRNIEVFHTSTGREVVHATYAAPPPETGWTRRVNGFYAVVIRDNVIFDQAGNALPGGRLGGFHVAIRPPAPGPQRPWLEFGTRNEDGIVFADLEFHPGDSGWRVTRWGPVAHLKGFTFLAKAQILQISVTDGILPAPAQRHSYRLGKLKPGFYRFVLSGSNGFTSAHAFLVEGEDPPSTRPFDRWRSTAIALLEEAGASFDSGDHRLSLRAYGFGFDPREGEKSGLVGSAVETSPDGVRRLVLTYPEVPEATDLSYRIETSDDLMTWTDRTAEVESRELVEMPDGTFRRTVSLPPGVTFARVRLVESSGPHWD